jgi:hypothetical protein
MYSCSRARPATRSRKLQKLSKAFPPLPIRSCVDNIRFEATPGADGCSCTALFAQRLINKNSLTKPANQNANLCNKQIVVYIIVFLLATTALRRAGAAFT